MAIPVSVYDVERALRPRLGVRFLSAAPIAERAAAVAREYAPYRMTLEELRDQLESCLLTSLSRYTGGSMTLVTDDYRASRLTLHDIARLTDDVMGVVFDCMPPLAINYEKLNEYALHVQSLSAMRALYQKYRAFATDEEYAFLRRMIRSVYAPSDYEAWLKPDGD